MHKLLIRLLPLVLLFCIFSVSCSNQENVIGEPKIPDGDAVEVCIDDYVYIIVRNGSGLGIGIVQKWENTPGGPRLSQCPKKKSIIPGKE